MVVLIELARNREHRQLSAHPTRSHTCSCHRRKNHLVSDNNQVRGRGCLFTCASKRRVAVLSHRFPKRSLKTDKTSEGYKRVATRVPRTTPATDPPARTKRTCCHQDRVLLVIVVSSALRATQLVLVPPLRIGIPPGGVVDIPQVAGVDRRIILPLATVVRIK